MAGEAAINLVFLPVLCTVMVALGVIKTQPAPRHSVPTLRKRQNYLSPLKIYIHKPIPVPLANLQATMIQKTVIRIASMCSLIGLLEYKYLNKSQKTLEKRYSI